MQEAGTLRLRRACTGSILAALVALVGLARTAPAQDEARQATSVKPVAAEVLPELGAHWVWVPDRLLRHSLLFDGDTGRVLGAIDSVEAITPKPPLWSRERGEVYSVDTAYSRGRRGERLDFVTIYDARTLAVTGEIDFPTRSADTGPGIALAALLDDGRFLTVFNDFPNASISILDLERRRFLREVRVTGCAGVYAVSRTEVATLCGNGRIVVVRLDEQGTRSGLVRSEPFFDAVEDPVTLSGVRDGDRWVFVSFEGQVHVIDFSGEVPRAGEPWSLFTAADREAGWRIGGTQHLALHRSQGLLYSVVHRGGPGSHKDPGREIWVHDLQRRERRARIEAPNLLVSFLRPLLGIAPESFWNTLLGWVVPNPGVHAVAVTQDESPLLFVRHADLGAVTVLDALSGERLRDLDEVGLSGPTLEVP